MEAKEQIKEKIDIVDLIGGYLQLTKAGANYRGRCPFHNEKTPSFMVSKEKQIFHCFGCSEGGDIFTFIEKIENLAFREALKFLGDKAGVKVESEQFDPLAKKKERMFRLNSLAAEYYYQYLTKTVAAELGRKYLQGRGYSPATLELWKIGFSPEAWDGMLIVARKKGFIDLEVVEGGLAVKNDKGKIYDRFRKRIMVPIYDLQGRVVGFTSRIIDPKDEQFGGKYVNTPQTDLYNKSKVVFGLDKAKASIKENDLVVIVEGNLDVISSHQVGVKNVVGVSGTALTEDHLKLISRFTENIAFCFDGDEAGYRALLKAFQIAQVAGMNVRIVNLPKIVKEKNIKDPDDLIRVDSRLWHEACTKPIEAMEYFFQIAADKYDLNSEVGKKQGVEFLLNHLILINDLITRDHWLSIISQRTGNSVNVLREKMAQMTSKKSESNAQFKTVKHNGVGNNSAISQLLALIFKNPGELPMIIDQLSLDMISDASYQGLIKALYLYYNTHKSFRLNDFLSSLDDNHGEQNLARETALLADKEIFNLEQAQLSKEIITLIQQLKTSFYKEKLRQAQIDLSMAEGRQDVAQTHKIMQQISELNDLIKKNG